MIKIIKNPNFPQFLEIFKDSTFIEEVQGRAKAFRIASKLAKNQSQKFFVFDNKKIDIDG